MVVGSSAIRSLVLPLGSPMDPVAPPTNAITLWPWSWKCSNEMIVRRLPTCKDFAVGSKPV